MSINNSISKEDIRYHIQDFDNESFLARKFQWLDKWMLYLPLYVRTLPSKSQRSKKCNIFMLFCIIVSIVGAACMTIAWYFAPKTPDFHSTNILLSIGIFCQIILMGVNRTLSFIYYYFHFNYPWHNKVAYLSNNSTEICTNNNKNCIHIVKHYKLLMKTYVFIYFMAFAMMVAGMTCWETNIYASAQMYNAIFAIFEWIVNEIPNCFTIVVQSTICFKYYYYLSQIMNNIGGPNMNMKDFSYLLLQYKNIYKAFQTDYNFTLKWSVILYIVSWLFDEFIGMQNPIYNTNDDYQIVAKVGLIIMGFGSLINIVIQVMLYIIPGVLLSETFQSLQELLWNELDLFIGDMDDEGLKCQSVLMTFITYITKYPIQISFAGLLMTRKNIIFFLAGFVATKCVAEIFRIYM